MCERRSNSAAPITRLITGYAGAQARMHFFLGGEIRIELVRFIGDLRMFPGVGLYCLNSPVACARIWIVRAGGRGVRLTLDKRRCCQETIQ